METIKLNNHSKQRNIDDSYIFFQKKNHEINKMQVIELMTSKQRNIIDFYSIKEYSEILLEDFLTIKNQLLLRKPICSKRRNMNNL